MQQTKNYPKNFERFLIAFGVKGIREYETFNARQKMICKTEYFKWLKTR